MSWIYFHCGLHKTGSSALQVMLTRRADALRSAGFLYPRSGRVGSDAVAHHNLAWQAAKDRRYSPGFGGLQELAREIQGFDGSVIVSSEDFESSLARPDVIRWLVKLSREVGKEPVFVIYLRDQASYFEALFQEMLNYGFGEDCPFRLGELIRNKAVKMHDWVFNFDYARIMEALEATAGAAGVVFRNYHTLHRGSIIADFCGVVGIAPESIGAEADYRTNRRDDHITSLLLFYENRAGSLFYRTRDNAVLEQPSTRIMMRLADRVSHLDLRVGPTLRRKVKRRFAESNLRVCTRHGLPLDGLGPSELVLDGSCVLFERFFSCDTQYAIRDLEHRLGAGTCTANVAELLAVEDMIDRLAAWWTDQTAPKEVRGV